MNMPSRKRFKIVHAIAGACVLGAGAEAIRLSAQQPATTAPSTLPADADVLKDLQARHRDLSNARSDLVAASLGDSGDGRRDDRLIAGKVKAVTDAEWTLAQTQARAAKAGTDPGRRIRNIPDLTTAQCDALTRMAGTLTTPALALSEARAGVTRAALSRPRDDAAIRAAVDEVGKAELSLSDARADAFAKIQASSDKLSPDQVSAFVAMGGILQLGGFHEPGPIDFTDHDGYASLFDGKTLKGWDGNPKIWRVEDGAIVGESTPQNPSGNSYLVYRDLTAKDFDLKFEIKIADNGGSGMQYRSKTGVPWLAPVDPRLRPVNLDWMMTGPQADFWPSQIYSGQFYSENTPMRIMAWRGQVVEAAGLGSKRLMATIGDRRELGRLENKTDWNQYTVIARGGTFIHIMNGQLMSVLIDDDPTSGNIQPGLIGIEIETVTKVFVRNVWMKKLN